jgi:hypothetical protein
VILHTRGAEKMFIKPMLTAIPATMAPAASASQAAFSDTCDKPVRQMLILSTFYK